VKITGPEFNQGAICEPILRSLPDWFGIEEANRQFLLDIENSSSSSPGRMTARLVF
jgi:hypothetical protein